MREKERTREREKIERHREVKEGEERDSEREIHTSWVS